MEDTQETLAEVIEALGLRMEAKFIPWHKSRNATKDGKAHPKDKCLNWTVTIWAGQRYIVHTDYQAGIGYCPSYKQGERWTPAYTDAINHECEEGTKWTGARFMRQGSPILPKMEDVLHSLVMDSDALYYDFKDWCDNLGYNADSIKAKSTYDQCLDIGLALQRHLGTKGLARLNEAYQDY